MDKVYQICLPARSRVGVFVTKHLKAHECLGMKIRRESNRDKTAMLIRVAREAEGSYKEVFHFVKDRLHEAFAAFILAEKNAGRDGRKINMRFKEDAELGERYLCYFTDALHGELNLYYYSNF